MDDETPREPSRQRAPRPSPFAGHSVWWWATASVCAVAVVGSVLLLML